MDIVFIRELKVDTVIGIHAWERRIRQTLVIDLELGADIRQAALTDNISHAVDYHAVATRVRAFVQTAEFQLVEALAEAVAELIQVEFQVPWLRLRLTKAAAVPGAAGVGVLIERGERS